MKCIQEHMEWIHAHEMDANTINGYKPMTWIHAHKMDTSTKNGYNNT